MRLLLVRHGESASNRRDDAQPHREARGEAAAAVEADLEAAKLATEPNGDTLLTENGHAQVEAFGKYWAPLLRGAAKAGKLQVSGVSHRR
jgi:broad specificity phosphatase PhoE